jgi:hypothetical protein
MKTFIDSIVTHQRKVTVVAWLTTVWAALQAHGDIAWPLDRAQWITIIGVTIATMGRSVLAPAKAADAPPEPGQ